MKTTPPPSAQAQAEPRGLVCPRCGYRHFQVIYTRPAWGGRILRRRECRSCGQRTLTSERVIG